MAELPLRNTRIRNYTIEFDLGGRKITEPGAVVAVSADNAALGAALLLADGSVDVIPVLGAVGVLSVKPSATFTDGVVLTGANLVIPIVNPDADAMVLNAGAERDRGAPGPGGVSVATNEAQTVGADGTVTVTNAATFQADLGVTYAPVGTAPAVALTNIPATVPATVPAKGQYSVTEPPAPGPLPAGAPATFGVYTFNPADAAAAVLISYAFGTPAAPASTTVTGNVANTGTIQSGVTASGTAAP